MAERVPGSLLAALSDLVQWLDGAGIPAVIVGGVAASLLGRPRLTRDIDALAMLAETDWETALAAAGRIGIVPRIEQPVDFARRSRVLLLQHMESKIDIDVILAGLPFERDAIAHGRSHDVGGVKVRLPRVEDLMIMKAIAHRPRDLQDVEGLLEAHPEVDLEVVRRWVREFAVAAAMPELIDDLRRLLDNRKSNRDSSG